MEAVVLWEEQRRGNHEHAVRISEFDLESGLNSYHTCDEPDNGIGFILSSNIASPTVAAPSITFGVRVTCAGKGRASAAVAACRVTYKHSQWADCLKHFQFLGVK